jgi:hypothetical protein
MGTQVAVLVEDLRVALDRKPAGIGVVATARAITSTTALSEPGTAIARQHNRPSMAITAAPTRDPST